MPITERDGLERGYVSYYLSRQKKQDAREYANNFTDGLSIVEEFVSEGYYISFSLDRRSGAVKISVSTYDKESVNYNLVLTEFNSDIDEALAQIYYFHKLVCGDKCWLDFASGFTPSRSYKKTD